MIAMLINVAVRANQSGDGHRIPNAENHGAMGLIAVVLGEQAAEA